MKATAVALLFWSQWHLASLGCIHSEELGEALLSWFPAHCRRNTACTSVQQSSDLFPTLPPVQPGEKVLRGVLTERCVAMFSANLKQFILTAHTQSLPICVPVPDYKVEVRRLDAIEDVIFPATMSWTRITTDRLKVVLLHAMQNLVASTRVPEGVEGFFYRQMHLLALLPSKGYCVMHMLLSALPTVHRLLLLLLLLVGLPCPQSHPRSPEPEPPQYPPQPPPPPPSTPPRP